MIPSGNINIQEYAKGFYFSSYEDKYIVIDNLDEQSALLVPPSGKIYNAEYVFVVIVLQGTLHIAVNSFEIDMRANEYLAVMPCMNITIHESQCTFFAFLTRSYLTKDIYEHSMIVRIFPFHAFSFVHCHFTPENTQIILDCYKRIKKEHSREDHPLKEMVLRAYQASYLARLFSFLKKEDVISHSRNNRQNTFFNRFLELLNENHKKERSVQAYASMMNITPKYLSTITQAFTGLAASQMIDKYVIYAIQQNLYINTRNIKTVSAEFNFPSQSFFGRYFKRITGMSPYEYIKKHNRKSLNFDHSTQKEK